MDGRFCCCGLGRGAGEPAPNRSENVFRFSRRLPRKRGITLKAGERPVRRSAAAAKTSLKEIEHELVGAVQDDHAGRQNAASDTLRDAAANRGMCYLLGPYAPCTGGPPPCGWLPSPPGPGFEIPESIEAYSAAKAVGEGSGRQRPSWVLPLWKKDDDPRTEWRNCPSRLNSARSSGHFANAPPGGWGQGDE